MNVQRLDLDLSKRPSTFKSIVIGQGDAGGTTIRAHVFDNGVAADLDGMTARFCMRLPDGIHYVRDTDCTVSGNTITYVVDESHCAAVKGMTNEAYFDILADGEIVYSTSRFSAHVLRGVTDGAVPGETYDSEVEDLIAELDGAIDGANAAATNANDKAAIASTATAFTNEATAQANAAAEDATLAAAQARGAISANLRFSIDIVEIGGARRLVFVDAGESE